MESGWVFPIILIFSLGFASVAYFHIDLQTVLVYGLKNLFVLCLLVFGAQFFITRTIGLLKSKHHLTPAKHEEEEAARAEVYSQKSKQSREQIQHDHEAKAESYRERILTPREDAKRAKKDEEFYRFLGPAWKGPGQALGNADSTGTGSNIVQSSPRESDGRAAADVRRLPLTVSETVVNTDTDVRKRERREILLPEEPPDDNSDCVTIVLKTPIGTSHRRRFLGNHTLQVVLDYMTTVGYHPGSYHLATSYPRRLLTDGESTLTDLDLRKQVLLNIEEKSDD